MKMGRLLMYLFLLPSVAAWVACGPPPPPPPATNVRTNVDENIDGIVVVRWDRSAEDNGKDGLFHYRVERSGNKDSDFKAITDCPTANVTECKDSNVIVGDNYEISYYYRVIAIHTKRAKDQNPESAATTPLQAKSINFNPPAPPTNLKAKANNIDSAQVVISWTGGKEVDLKGYYVYRSLKDEPIPVIDPSLRISKLIEANKGESTVQWVDKEVTPGTRYCYTVAAADKGGLVSQTPPSLRKCDMLIESVQLEFPQEEGTTTTKPTFKWKPVPNAQGYVIVVQSQKFGGTLWRSSLVKEASLDYGGPALTASKKYYWYVYAYSSTPDNNNEDGNSVSPVWAFTPQ